MKTQEIAILDLGLGLDDEIGYEDMLNDIGKGCINWHGCNCSVPIELR